MIYQTENRSEVKFLSNIKSDFVASLRSDFFQKQFISRRVLSVYYDTYSLKFYRDHVDGCGERVKHRLRAYTNSNKVNKNLSFNYEVKHKIFKVGYKKIIKKFVKIKKINSSLPPLHSAIYGYLRPVVAIIYDREYYYSPIKGYRITIDSNLNFFLIINNKIDLNKKVSLTNLYIKEKWIFF